jgi:glycosyltransferase involved in cell wall biosynthesis
MIALPTPRTPTITAVVVVLNERDHLRTLLPQLDWCDERLVVDGGSTDGSAEAAAELGARVVTRPFDDFARQRNAALDAAQGDWAFFVDADERSSPRLAAEVRDRTACERRVGYRVPIRSTIFGRTFRFSGTQNDCPLRLVRRDAGRWVGAVHERFAVRGPVGRLEAPLGHITLPTIRSFLGKMQRYTALAAAARIEAGIAPRWSDSWVRPPLEVFRRLVWKQGWLDGPEGFAFCGLSGLSEWLLARQHRRLWREAQAGRTSSSPAKETPSNEKRPNESQSTPRGPTAPCEGVAA